VAELVGANKVLEMTGDAKADRAMTKSGRRFHD